MGLDSLAPAGSSTYQSNTLFVGDGTWDATKNDFLLPNLVGLNFETMRYNGMGNRFSSLPQYHSLILGHGVLAAIVFLFFVPGAIIIARFYTGRPGWAVRFHIYLNVLTILLTTVIFTLGWFAVGQERSLTNPHHGIGLFIFIAVLVQAIGGARNHARWRARRGISVFVVLHHWFGRIIALLGLAQVPLGLTLYGSPKYLFILYTLWVFFLVVLYFILSYRAETGVVVEYDRRTRLSAGGGTVISDRKRPGLGSVLAPLAAGAGLAALLSRGRNNNRSRNRSRSPSRERSRSRVSRSSRREEVIPTRDGPRRGGSRRDSAGSFIEEEEREKRNERRPSGGLVDRTLKVGAVAGAYGLAKAWWERPRGGRKTPTIRDDEYSSVAMDTPSRRPREPIVRHTDSDLSEDTESALHMAEMRNSAMRPVLPTSTSIARPFTPVQRPVTPPNPAIAAAAISAAEPRLTNHPTPTRVRRDSYYDDSDSLSSPGNTPIRKGGGHTLRNSIAAAGLVAGIGSYFKNRREKKEQARIDDIRNEKSSRENGKKHGVGHVSPRTTRLGDYNEDSVLSSDFTESIVEDSRRTHSGGPIPPLAATVAGEAGAQSRSRQELSQHSLKTSNFPVEPEGDVFNSPGGRDNRRHSSSSTRRRAEEAAAALAAGLVAEQVSSHRNTRRERSNSATGTGSRRSQSRVRDPQDGIASPPVSVRIQMHGDNNRNVTLRRLSEAEAAAEREASHDRRKLQKGSRGRGSESASSLSGTDFSIDNLAQKRRYRRDESERLDQDERRRMEQEAERKVEASDVLLTNDLAPPNPAFAKGKPRASVPKGSIYSSGSRGTAGVSSRTGRGAGVESPDSGNRSHGTWSGITPAQGNKQNTSGSRPGTSGGLPPGVGKENILTSSGGLGSGLSPSGITGTGLGSEEDAAERRRRRRAERSATGGGQPTIKTVEFE